MSEPQEVPDFQTPTVTVLLQQAPVERGPSVQEDVDGEGEEVATEWTLIYSTLDGVGEEVEGNSTFYGKLETFL